MRDNLNITPYLVLSGFNKDQKGYKDSQRNIIGAAWNYKNIAVYTEYVMSKNDVFIGGNADSFAAGDDNKWNKLANVIFTYTF